MSNRIESNIILQTEIPQPKGDGFGRVHQYLERLDKKLQKITSKEYTIKINFDESALERLGYSLKRKIKKAEDIMAGRAGPGSAGGLTPPSTGGELTSVRRTQTFTKKGTRTSITGTTEEAGAGVNRVTKVTEDASGNVKKIEETETNVAAKERAEQRKRDEKKRANLEKEEQATNARREAAQARLHLNSELSKKEQELQRIFSEDAIVAKRHLSDSLHDQKVLETLERQKAAFESRTHGKATLRENRDRTKRELASENLNRNRTTTRQAINAALDSGAKELEPPRLVLNRKTGQIEEIIRLQQVTGNFLTGYKVKLLEANVEQGKFTTQVLEGAAASRKMGDSLGHAILKVGLWTAATGTVFAVVRGLANAAGEVSKLEESTVLLARVGSNLGADFNQRYEAAKKVTAGILEMTTAIGGNSDESLRAAAVFARAGQTEQQVLDNTRASLLAARIAELGVEDAAQLLSSAMLQFGDSTSQALPVLDKVNTLSNNYRVTSNDLLQSISRTGSVFAAHNSRLSELAATTAVTAQVTSRSGAEIGNAMKTIISQLDRVETKRVIFERLGVNVHDVGGVSKSYTQTLLELSLATQQVTDAERNQISVQIAGVRQRNILLAQMKNIIGVMKAENLALIGDPEDKGFGSASKEFLQTSGTLVAALQRLQAQVLQFANAFGGPLKAAAKDVTNIITGLLRVLSSGNGFGARLVAQVAIVGLLAAGLQVLSPRIQSVTASLVQHTTALLNDARAAYQNAAANAAAAALFPDAQRSTGAAAAGFAAVAGSITASAGALIASIGPWVAVALVIYGVTKALGALAEQEQIAREVETARSENLQKSISRERDRAQALDNTRNAVASLLLEIERLEKVEARGGAKQGKLKGQYAGQARELANSVGVTLGNGVTPEQAEKAFLEQMQKIRAKEIEQQQGVKEQASGSLRGKRSLLTDAQERAKKLRESIAEEGTRTSGLGDIYGTGGGIATNFESELASTSLEIEKIKKEISELEGTGEKATKRIEELGKSLEMITARKRGIGNLNALYRSTFLSNQRAEETATIRPGLVKATTLDEQKQAQIEITDLEKRRVATVSLINRMLDTQAYSLEEVKSVEEQLDKLTEKSLKSQLTQYEQIRKIQRETISEQLSRRSKLQEGAFGISAARTRGLDPTHSSFLDPLAAIDAQREGTTRSIKQQLGDTNRLLKGPKTEESIAATESLKLKTQEDINRLKDLEIERALALLDAEKNIALERKKSADEALRALGALSDEDKLRALAQAQYFAKNPGKKISAEDQFLRSGEDNRITQQFFGSKLEDFSESRSRFKDSLSAGGFGVSSDLARGEKELDKLRAGRSSDRIVSDAMRTSNDLARQSGVLGGNQAQIGALQFGQGSAGGSPRFGTGGTGGGISLEVKNSSINFGPVLTAFETSFTKLNQASIDAAAKRFERIVDDKIRSATRVRTAAVAPPAAGGE